MTSTARGIRHRIKWRTLCFELLGDLCIGCGTEDRQVFTINHVDGNGHLNRHNKNRQPNWKKYCEQVLKGNPRLEIQCYNCHAKMDLKRNV